MKVPDIFQKNFELVSDCHKCWVKMAECNRIQLVRSGRYMGTYGNEIADHLAKQYSSPPLIGPEPALGMSTKAARGVIKCWTSRKHNEHWESIHG